MKPVILQAVTWATIAAAVGSALWLAAAESNAETSRGAPNGAMTAGSWRHEQARPVIPVALRTTARSRDENDAPVRVETISPAPAPR